MGKQFRAKKETIKKALISFINIPGVVAEEKNVIEETLYNYSSKGIDFTDAYIAAHARSIKPPHIITENIKDLKG
ncbi:type II toxin-antitoxin system VapC family toxin [Oceanobacillus halotolerans]|uniref:type II toxin-antitoxin system VapC family toxin n=1 Tax=Oceanobacillus halotolerans TaxID=2663380 RepID=UPI0013D969E3